MIESTQAKSGGVEMAGEMNKDRDVHMCAVLLGEYLLIIATKTEISVGRNRDRMTFL